MENNAVEETHSVNEDIHPKFDFDVPLEGVKYDLESCSPELKETVKGKLLRVYQLEKEREEEGSEEYSHRRVLKKFLSLLENNRSKALVRKDSNSFIPQYEQKAWDLYTFGVTLEKDFEPVEFSIYLKLKEDSTRDIFNKIELPFTKDDFSDLDFEGGAEEREEFYNATLSVLYNFACESGKRK